MAARLRIPLVALAFTVFGSAAIAGCGAGDGASASGGKLTAADKQAVIDHYAKGVFGSYWTSLKSAQTMDAAIKAFVASPTDETLTAARTAWFGARSDYGTTEAFRFYGGPIDVARTGVEVLINAWPIDEGFVDYVEGNPESGIINDPVTYPTIDAELLTSLNLQGGETNVSAGWHVIEFLLWGQDLNSEGPGARPVTDYTTAANAQRRGAYLLTASEVLLGHLEALVESWKASDPTNYRAEFEKTDQVEALQRILTGLGELTETELSGQRLSVPYTQRSQEDEHSCFSDNTIADLIANTKGVEMVVMGTYPGVTGPGLIDLVRKVDPTLAGQLENRVNESVKYSRGIPFPFDRLIGPDIADTDPGRATIPITIEALNRQAEALREAGVAIGATNAEG
jgi:putative iron-regulated protein